MIFLLIITLLISSSEGPITCVSLNNQRCQAGTTIINLNSNKTGFYLFTFSINPYSQVFVSSKVRKF